MVPDINLIPQKEVIEQQKTQAVKTSTVLSILIMVAAIVASAYFFIITEGLKKQLKDLDSSIATKRGQIAKLSSIEINARNLDKKFKVLSSLFDNRIKYSIFLEEFKARKPETIRIESIDANAGTLNVSGNGDSYLSIAGFINSLLDKNFATGNPKLKDLFTSVSLNSVSLDKGSNQVKFFIVVAYDESKLKQ